MSSNKIDSKRVVSQIFDSEKPFKGLPSKSPVDSLVKSSPAGNFSFSRFGSLRRLSFFGRNEFGGIDLGNDSIKFVLLSQTKRGLSLEDVQIEKLPLQKAREEAEIKDEEKVALLSKITARLNHKIKTGISLNDPILYLDMIKLPTVTEQEKREVVRREMTEKNLVDPEHHFFDFETSAFLQSDTKTAVEEVLVAAAPKPLVYRQFEMVQSAGFKVHAIEPASLALFHAVNRVKTWKREERVMLLDLGHLYSNLSLVRGGKLVLNRTISIGGRRFTNAIADTLNCTYEKAEQLKIQYGLQGLEESKASGASQAPEVSLILKQELERLLAEIERSFQFAFTQESEAESYRLSSVFLAGGSSRLKGLKGFFEKKLETSCETMDLWKDLNVNSMRVDREILLEDQPLLAVALGLALRISEWKALPFGLGISS